MPFADAVVRQLRQLDRSVPADEFRLLLEGRSERDVRRALAQTRRERPTDVRAYFRSVLGRRVETEATRPLRLAVPPLVTGSDPYA